MRWETAFSIMFAVIAGNLFFAWRDRVRARRAARTEIPAYRNWRGEYVPDLRLIRARRLAIMAFVVFLIAILAASYFILTNYRPA